ncbi:MAG: hypothetical protein ACTSU2_02235 [Promethearchaeota archaeon]
MSIHGIQKIMPYLLDPSLEMISTPGDLAIGLINCLEKYKEGEKLKIFSRIAWPLIFTQGDPSSHIVFDDVGISKMKINITNAPRLGAIGHVLRNIDQSSYSELLQRIKKIILYTEEGKQYKSEEKEEELEEYKEISIKGLMNPKLIAALEKLITKVFEESISNYALLESQYSLENALEWAEQYRNYIELLKGNAIRWENAATLIKKHFDEWLIELNVKIKDAKMRYKSTISKEESSITEEQVKEMLDAEKDKLDQWNLIEKKKVLEKIGGAFLPIDQFIEDIHNKNTHFTNTDNYKRGDVKKALFFAKKHIEFLEKSVETYKQKINALKSAFEKYRNNINEIDAETEKRYKEKELELKTKLSQRNSRIQTINEASLQYIKNLEEAKEMLEQQLNELIEIIKKKAESCRQDKHNLESWGLKDNISNLSMPVIRIFMSAFVALYEDEEEEERLVVCLPCTIDKNLEIKSINESFRDFEETIEKTLDEDMKIRSNFEFAMDKSNLLTSSEFYKKLDQGFKLLKNAKYLNDEIEQKYKKLLEELKDV